MPRPIRADLEPEILLPDISEQQRRATGAIDQERYRAIVYNRNSSIGRDPRFYVFNRIEAHLQECRASRAGIDEGFLYMMMGRCDLAVTREQRDSDGEPIRRDGLFVHRLVRVGCRVRMTQYELGHRYGKGRQFANEQIAKLGYWYFIVNQGRGWYEFAASLCWRGNLGSCAAYREVQRVRDGLVFTDGRTTLVAEEIVSDDDGGEHSGQRVEEEGS